MIKRFLRLFLSETTAIEKKETPRKGHKKTITREDIKRKQKEIFSYTFSPRT